MLTEYDYSRNYLFTGLEAGPDVFDSLLRGLTPEEADFRPDPARFTIREIMAHQVTWEGVFLERLKLTCDMEEPTLPLRDESDRIPGYAALNPTAQSQAFRACRSETVAFLRDRAPQDWGRVALRQTVGPMTLEAQALLIPLHDTYHFQQIGAWRTAFAAQASTSARR